MSAHSDQLADALAAMAPEILAHAPTVVLVMGAGPGGMVILGVKNQTDPLLSAQIRGVLKRISDDIGALYQEIDGAPN